IRNFKPTLWEGALLSQFHSVSIADAMATKPTDIQGEKVVFTKIKKGAVNDYAGSVNWAEVDTDIVEMTFPKQKYFAIKLDDVDKVQLKKDTLKPIADEHGAVLAETYDADFFTELTSSGQISKLGSASSKKSVHAKNIYDFIVDLGTELSKKKVPKTDRFVTVSAEVLGLLSKDPRFTVNPTVLSNGFVEGQKINGLQVMTSEELPQSMVVAHHKSAIGAAKQIQKTEAMRLENSFADGIRGLLKYGFKRLRDDAVAVLYYSVVETPRVQAGA
ncbi:hypothetical protein, partial [Gemella sp. zg-1178]|uniref:hypothetical protein n=1 Tax=Gemella sp. zg-1178 TaxID=2840372 RepID=UPI001C040588